MCVCVWEGGGVWVCMCGWVGGVGVGVCGGGVGVCVCVCVCVCVQFTHFTELYLLLFIDEIQLRKKIKEYESRNQNSADDNVKI